MKQFDFLEMKEILYSMVRRIAFKTMSLRDGYALLTVQNRRLVMDLAMVRVESALLAIICPIQVAIFRLSGDPSAHFQKKDCFECLLPHEMAV